MDNHKISQNSEQAWRITLVSDDVTVSSHVHIADDSIKDSRTIKAAYLYEYMIHLN